MKKSLTPKFMPLLYCVIIKLIVKFFSGHRPLSLTLHGIHLNFFLVASFKFPRGFRYFLQIKQFFEFSYYRKWLSNCGTTYSFINFIFI